MDRVKRSSPLDREVNKGSVELLGTLTFYGDGMKTSIHSSIFHVIKIEGQDKVEKLHNVKWEEVLMMLSQAGRGAWSEP